MEIDHADRLKRQMEQAKANVAELLMMDADLAFTFLRLAEITKLPEHQVRLIGKAAQALEVIRRISSSFKEPRFRWPVRHAPTILKLRYGTSGPSRRSQTSVTQVARYTRGKCTLEGFAPSASVYCVPSLRQ